MSAEPKEEIVRVATGEGTMTCRAWRLGALAVTEYQANDKGYTITHLPSGLAFRSVDCNFSSRDDAIRALIQIEPLFDWTRIPTAAERKKLGPKIQAVANQYRVMDVPHGFVGKRKVHLNGYAEANA